MVCQSIREPLENNETADEVVNHVINRLPKITIKDRVKLSKCQNEWDTANGYFKLHIDHTSEIIDVDAIHTAKLPTRRQIPTRR